MTTHSSVFAWRIPGTGEPDGLPSVGSQSRTRLKWLSSSRAANVRGAADSVGALPGSWPTPTTPGEEASAGAGRPGKSVCRGSWCPGTSERVRRVWLSVTSHPGSRTTRRSLPRGREKDPDATSLVPLTPFCQRGVTGSPWLFELSKGILWPQFP